MTEGTTNGLDIMDRPQLWETIRKLEARVREQAKTISAMGTYLDQCGYAKPLFSEREGYRAYEPAPDGAAEPRTAPNPFIDALENATPKGMRDANVFFEATRWNDRRLMEEADALNNRISTVSKMLSERLDKLEGK